MHVNPLEVLSESTRGVLVRVGIDQTYGNWNAPCNEETGDFVYVPIPESQPNDTGLERTYLSAIDPVLQTFARRSGPDSVQLPEHLAHQRMHLDPDFEYLTYGDTERRGNVLLALEPGDLVVFYSGMRALRGRSRLVYGLIGLLVVSAVKRVADVHPDNFVCNAHTRRRDRHSTDVIVFGKSGVSGRFRRYIEIGEWRNRSYRVRCDLLEAWGGLSVNDGFLQRSANPPKFCKPKKFGQWLANQSPELIAANNPVSKRPCWLC